METKSELDDFFFSSVRGLGVTDALPDGVAITFVLSGPEGGTWSVSRNVHGDVTVVRRAVKRPDCHMACSTKDFARLVRGELNVRQAFLDERVTVKGDVGLVWRLQKLLVARLGA